jgi:DNA-binding transcriptional ArsR family regulator
MINCGYSSKRGNVARKLSEDALRLVAERFKALGEPMRLRLIMALEQGEKNVGQIVEEVVSTQANVSRHLQYLTDAGILKRRKEGLHVFYSISDPRVFDLCQVVCGSLEQHFHKQVKAFK